VFFPFIFIETIPPVSPDILDDPSNNDVIIQEYENVTLSCTAVGSPGWIFYYKLKLAFKDCRNFFYLCLCLTCKVKLGLDDGIDLNLLMTNLSERLIGSLQKGWGLMDVLDPSGVLDRLTNTKMKKKSFTKNQALTLVVSHPRFKLSNMYEHLNDS